MIGMNGVESVWHFIRLRCANDREAVSIPIYLWRRGCRRWSMRMINLHLKWRWDNDQFSVMPNSIYTNLLNIDSWLPSGHKFQTNDGVRASDFDCILVEVNFLLVQFSSRMFMWHRWRINGIGCLRETRILKLFRIFKCILALEAVGYNLNCLIFNEAGAFSIGGFGTRLTCREAWLVINIYLFMNAFGWKGRDLAFYKTWTHFKYRSTRPPQFTRQHNYNCFHVQYN